jgi:hypothetical protein
MYLPDPVATLRRLRLLLEEDGFVAFVEMDLEATRSVPAVPLVTTAVNWVIDTLRRGGAQSAMGPQVWHVLADAGFVEAASRVWWEAVRPPAIDLSRILAETELTRARATLLPPAIVGTWARMPTSSSSS